MGKPVTDSRAFGRSPAFAYLDDHDRHLSAVASPLFRFGYIGCGMMGQEHMRNTLLEGRAGVGGLFDPAERSVKHALRQLGDAAAGATVYGSVAEACADPDTDAVIIATPNHTHLDVMRAAVRHDKAIFLEKPIASTVDDAVEVCRLAADHDNIVRLGMQYRYKAIYAEAIHEVHGRGSVGRVHSINLLEHRFPFLDKVGQWNKFNALSGGTLVEKCCHYFDLINLFAGAMPVRVYASGSRAVNFASFRYDGRPADGIDQAHVNISYENGVIGAFSLCMFVPGSREELIVCGDSGRLHCTETAQLGARSQNHMELWAGENGASRVSSPSYPDYIANAGHHGSTFFEHVAFIDDLIAGTSSGPSPAEALLSVAVGAAAQLSIERHDAVDVADVLPDGVLPSFAC